MVSCGFVTYRDERYQFEESVALFDKGKVTACAWGDDGLIYFCGIPFGAALKPEDIIDRRWSGEGDTPLSEGRLTIVDRTLHMMSGRINCISASTEKQTVALEFRIRVYEEENNCYLTIEGGIRGRIVEHDDFPWEMTH